MEDVGLVGVAQRSAQLAPNGCHLGRRQRGLLDPIPQGATVDVFHDDVRAAVGQRSSHMHGHDVGAARQPTESLAFTLEPQAGHVVAESLMAHLDRHLAPHRGLIGQPDSAEPARAEGPLQLESRNLDLAQGHPPFHANGTLRTARMVRGWP